MRLRNKRNESKTKEKLDYDFNYDHELEIYKSIGSSKGSKKKREAKRTVNLVCNLLIPIEIGAITIFCNVNDAIDNFYEMIGFVVSLLGVVILIVIKEISDAEKEGYFVDDLLEILFEEK